MYNPPTTTTSQDFKYTVAELLSSLASGDPPMTPTSLALMSTGISTGTTPTLTPTTLQSIESALASVADYTTTTTATVAGHQREAGFIPPLIDPVSTSVTATTLSGPMVKQEFPDWYQDDSSLSEEGDWMPPYTKMARASGPDGMGLAPPYGTIQGQANQTPPNRRGGRRIRHEEHLTPEEASRKNVRRERNKLAAAKCRQRRVDLTNTLLNESEQLEDEQSKLENDIQNLQQQKEQLEFLLEAHRPVCTAKVGTADVKAEKIEPSQTYVTSAVSTASSTILVAPPAAHSHVPLTHGLSILNTTIPATGMTSSRPSTLPIFSKTLSGASITDATGVPITTPSTGMGMFTPGFTIGLDSMMDGHTGLTPITGAPSCASQVHRTSSSDTTSSTSESLSSPTTLMAL